MDIRAIRNAVWIRVLPFLLAILLATAALHALHISQECGCNFLAAVLLVVGYRHLVRYTITRHYTKGVRLVRAQRFEEAIGALEQSLAFFEKYPSLDTWRSILFLNVGMYGYREMALLNLGYTYAMLMEGDKSEQCYKKALELNPRNRAAVLALNLLDAGKRMQLDESQSEQAGLSS